MIEVPLTRISEVGLTLVAFYGPKPTAMDEFVATIQGELRMLLGGAFTAYELAQVHGTIIGLEGRRTEAGILNNNLNSATGESRSMDLQGLLHFMLDTPQLPLRVRFGGFARSRTYPFTSRGLHPYVRSFAFHGPLAVIVGWPVTGELYPMSLDNLRRKCTRYNILHKYHHHASDIDNDFFLVLGQVEKNLASEEKIESTQNRLRDLLSSRLPLDITIGREQLSVVAYNDRQLPRSSSFGYSLVEAHAGLARIESLYETQG